MTPERWEEIKTMILSKFPVEYHETEDTEDMLGKIEVIECESPVGSLRVEYVTRPRVSSERTGGAFGRKSDDDKEIQPQSPWIYELHLFIWDDVEHDWTNVHADMVEKL